MPAASPPHMTRTMLEHPIAPNKMLSADNFAALEALVMKLQVVHFPLRWERLHIVPPTPGAVCPEVQLMAGSSAFLLGEIGLSYLCYRVGVPTAAALGLYREAKWKELDTLLFNGFSHFTDHYSYHLPSRDFVATILDGELMGLLTGYTAVKHTEICASIKVAGMASRVVGWVWRPTELSILIRDAILTRKFFAGAKVLNGETGHRAISFYSTLWCESIVSKSGEAYSWERPVAENGYARHMYFPKITKVMNALEAALKETALQHAYERLSELPGKWAFDLIMKRIDIIKCRTTARTKLLLALDDALIIPRTEKALDVMVALLNEGMGINKTTMKLAEEMADILLVEAGKL